MTDLVVTYSGLGKFAQCKRMWYLSEYLGLRRKDEPHTGPLPFGSRIHSALEAWGTGLVPAPVDIWESLMALEYTFAAAHGHTTEKLDKENKLGHIMLSGFPGWLEEEGFFAKYETISVETALTDYLMVPVILDGEVIEVKVMVRGKADQIIRRKSDGYYLILDWKTTSALAESVLGVMVKSPQTRIYALLAKAANPGFKFAGGLIVLLRKVLQTKTANPPFYGSVEIPISKTDMIAYRQRLRGAVQDMVTVKAALDNGHNPDLVAYFTPSRVTCTTCPFKLPCDLMASYPTGADDMIENLYEKHDPFERYAKGNDDDNLIEGWVG